MSDTPIKRLLVPCPTCGVDYISHQSEIYPAEERSGCCSESRANVLLFAYRKLLAAHRQQAARITALEADAQLGKLVREAVGADFGISVEHTMACDDNRIFEGCTCGAVKHQRAINAAIDAAPAPPGGHAVNTPNLDAVIYRCRGNAPNSRHAPILEPEQLDEAERELAQLRATVTSLEAERERLVAALQVYADANNWGCPESEFGLDTREIVWRHNQRTATGEDGYEVARAALAPGAASTSTTPHGAVMPQGEDAP